MTSRIAEEKQWTVGEEVGFKMRFSSQFSEKTSLLFVTYGMLIRELMHDPHLTEYSVVMIDEVIHFLYF